MSIASVTDVSRWPAQAMVALVTAYQRYISPYKGFCCAYRAVHGGRSCSAHAKTLLARGGVRIALAGMRRRFAACGAAFDGLDGAIRPRTKYDPPGTCPCVCDCGPSWSTPMGNVTLPIRCCW